MHLHVRSYILFYWYKTRQQGEGSSYAHMYGFYSFPFHRKQWSYLRKKKCQKKELSNIEFLSRKSQGKCSWKAIHVNLESNSLYESKSDPRQKHLSLESLHRDLGLNQQTIGTYFKAGFQTKAKYTFFFFFKGKSLVVVVFKSFFYFKIY